MVKLARRPWPIGGLGALVLVALIELILSRQPLRFTDTASLSWRLAMTAATKSAEPCRVACLGDSLVKIGVLPNVIEAVTGRSTHNFAMARAPAPATYFLLRRMLDAGARLDAIVVDFKPSILAGGPRFNLRQWQETLYPSEAAELASLAGGVRFFNEIVLGQILTSYRDRWEIREAISAALTNQVASTYRNNRLALRNWRVNGGAHLNGSKLAIRGALADESRRKLIIPRWMCHRVNAIYVEKFLKLAESRKIAVYWLIAPSSPGLQVLRESEGGDVAYADFIATMQRKHPSVTVIDGRRSGYDSSTFADATHLNGRGASTLSHELARILTRAGSLTAKWISLPLFRDWSLDAPGEDIDRSTQVIDAELIRR